MGCDWESIYGGTRYNPEIREKCTRCLLERKWVNFVMTKQVPRKDGTKPPNGYWEYEDPK